MMTESQTTAVRLTPAQRRALEWLPSDGRWKGGVGRMTAALNSLSVAMPGRIEAKFFIGGDGMLERRWRLVKESPYG